MKHSCGKEFDSHAEVKRRDEKNARIIARDLKCPNGFNIVSLYQTASFNGEKEDVDYHLPCGHVLVDHKDDERDLINIPKFDLERVWQQMRQAINREQKKIVLEIDNKAFITIDEFGQVIADVDNKGRLKIYEN